jgi:hypothetical protein
LAFAVALGFAIRAFFVEGLFRETLWNADGRVRLGAFAAIYWPVAAILLRFRPAWFFPAATIFVFIYSEWWCAEFFSVWAPLAVLFFLGSCFQLGRLLFRELDAALSTLVGLTVWIFLLSIAVHFPVNRPSVYAISFAIPYLARWKRPKISWPPATAGHALLVFVLLIHWLIALKPDISSDGLAMHLAIPEMIAHQARFTFDFQFYAWALMPMGGDFAFAGVYLLGGESAARLLDLSMLVLITAMVYKASLQWLTPGRAALAAALFASTPLAELVTGSLFVENIWAALVTGAGLALWSGEILPGAILLGGAFATKLGTSAYLAPAIVLACISLHQSLRRGRTAALATLLLIGFAAPPYLNAWIKSGNPIFPFANAMFRSPYFESAASLVDVRYRQNHDLNALYDLTFRSGNFIEGQGGALGFQYFLLLAPLLLLLSRKAPRGLIFFGLTGAVITFVSVPNLRYVYPALPLLSIGLGWLICEMPAMLLVAVAILGLNLWFLPAAGWNHPQFALFTRRQFDEYLSVGAPQRKLVEVLNRIAPGEPVAFLHGDPIAGLHAKAYSDQWHTYRFWKALIAATDAAQISALVHQLGIHYVVAPPQPDLITEQHFLEEWTAPTGYASGTWELRRVVDVRIVKPRDTIAVPPGIYDDMETRIDYAGAWLHDRQFSGTAGQSITYSKQPGDALHFYFYGTAIEYVYTKAFNRGVAEVRIDGEVRAQIDLYSKETLYQQRSAFRGLGAGAHSIEVRVTNRKNPESSDYFVDLDEFIVANQN